MARLEQIKKDLLVARKTGDKLAVALLSTLIGDVEMIGKNAVRPVTDADVVKVTKKFIDGIDMSIAYLQKANNAVALATVSREKTLLTVYMPDVSDQLSETQLTAIVDDLVDTIGNNMGAVMKELKAQFAGKYDSKLASEIVKKALV